MTTTPITWANCQVTLGELQPWADNPRLSTKAQARRMLESWQRFGQVQTIAIGPGGQVYDGHQRLSALLTLHGKSYQVDARRADRELTDEERRALVVTLHAGAVGAWNWDSLSGWEAGLLTDFGFDSDTLTNWQRDVTALGNLLASEEAESADAEPQVDRAAELQEKWQVKPGDVWRIGEHRLACGDCTDKAVVERVMGGEKAGAVVTDPPYNVDVAGGSHDPRDTKNYRSGNTVDNDHMTSGEFRHFLRTALSQAANILTEGGACYVCFSDSELETFATAYREAGFYYSQMIVWAKQQFVFGRKDYHSKHEPILYGWKPGAAHYFIDDRTQDTLWQIDRPMRSEKEHPTQKPVELFVKAISNSSKLNGVVFDPFLGSGTTLVACQNLHRRGRGIEISPEYCAVVLQRMFDAFGITGERIADSTSYANG